MHSTSQSTSDARTIFLRAAQWPRWRWGLLLVAMGGTLYVALPGFGQTGSAGFGEESNPHLLAERKRFEQEVEAALQPAQKRYTLRLQALQKAMLRSGDKEGAAAVEAELERLGQGAAQTAQYPIEGTWMVGYSNGSKRTYQLAADGQVLFVEEKRSGRFTRSGNDLLVDFNDGKLERFYWTMGLALQHYDPKTSYPAGKPKAVGFALKR